MENNTSITAVSKAEKEKAHRVDVRHVGRVELEYGNIWLGDGTGGSAKTLFAVINDALMANGIDRMDGLAELVLTIEPLDGAGTEVEVV